MAVTESDVIGKGEALSILRAGREQSQAKANAPNPVTEAARTLGQHAAAARKAQQTTQAPQDKPAPVAKPQNQAAPLEDKPDEAEDNAEESAPEGQGAVEDQPQDATEAETDDGDGSQATIEIDGQKLTAQEIRDSYLRRDDYTRKTQEVAHERQVLQQSIGAVTQNSQRIEQLVTLLESAVGQEPDWAMEAMRRQPQDFLAFKENWHAQMKVLTNVRVENQKAQAASISQAKTAMFDEAARTFRPEWQDRAKMQEGVNQLADYAVSEGIHPQELQMLHRTPMLKILDKSFKWDELQRTQRVTDKKVQNKPKPVRPGSQPNRQNAAEAQLTSERQAWESNKRPSTSDARRWLQAKANYEASTGKLAG